MLHGSSGSGETMMGQNFAGQLFGPGQPLDAAKYYIIVPDAVGSGKSSKPSAKPSSQVTVHQAVSPPPYSQIVNR